MPTKKKLTFEENLSKLDDLVKRLESGDLTLDESLKAFEAAKKLESELEAELDGAKARITVLIGQDETEFELEDET